jgi:hypothetical protein
MSDIDGAAFVKILNALEKYSSIIPPNQLTTLRHPDTLKIFESTAPLSLFALYMPDEDKIILTFGRKSYDMSMFVRNMGFRPVDVIHTDYMKYEAIFDWTGTSTTTKSSSMN